MVNNPGTRHLEGNEPYRRMHDRAGSLGKHLAGKFWRIGLSMFVWIRCVMIGSLDAGCWQRRSQQGISEYEL